LVTERSDDNNERTGAEHAPAMPESPVTAIGHCEIPRCTDGINGNATRRSYHFRLIGM
jgi:hypothetical protein